MKRLIPFTFLVLFALSVNAQTTLIYEPFTSYDGTSGTVPTGWTFNYNANYTSTQSSGPSGPNSYKFGVDTATIITPAFSNADTVKFWYKGNQTDSTSSLEILQTDDFVTWFQLGLINPVSGATTGYQVAYPVGHNIKQIKFVYHKSVGNCAFDDFYVISNATPVKNINKSEKPFVISPNPSNGPVVIDFLNKQNSEPQFTIYNMIGSEIKDAPVEKISNQRYIIKLNNRQPGFYFIRVKTDKMIYTTRITITAMASPQKAANTSA